MRKLLLLVALLLATSARAEKLGVSWGEDELGWWAAIQTSEFPSWSVRRYDDNGNSVLVEANLTEDQAKSQVAAYEAKGHKQMYWAKDDSQA